MFSVAGAEIADDMRHAMAQPGTLHSDVAYAGRIPVDLFGGAAMPAIDEQPYVVMLPGHTFYWCELLAEADRAPRARAGSKVPDRPELPPANTVPVRPREPDVTRSNQSGQ